MPGVVDRRPFGSGPGRQVLFRMLHVFEFRNGCVSRENVWMDSATLVAQLA